MCAQDEVGWASGEGAGCLLRAVGLLPSSVENQWVLFQGQGFVNPSISTPGASLRNSRPVEKADFNAEKASSAEQEILSPCLY